MAAHALAQRVEQQQQHAGGADDSERVAQAEVGAQVVLVADESAPSEERRAREAEHPEGGAPLRALRLRLGLDADRHVADLSGAED